ncbi:MAG: hypothetical protein ACYDHN_11030 [Solirubrobacteraceae bacterium]
MTLATHRKWDYQMVNKVQRSVKFRRGTLSLAMVIATALAALVGTSSAMATPTGEYAVFADCPLSNSSLSACVQAKTESGEFIVGKETVPITKAITLQGGFIENEETEAITFVAAADGNTLSKTPQPVPGGLAGLFACKEISNIIERIACEVTFENGVTGVNATTELAAPASSIGLNESNLLGETGTALSLPVKVHLENPFLGSECYIGSNSSPIVINFTTGTTSPPAPNKPIKGSAGTTSVNSEGTILTISKNSLVNNSFAAPGTSGCGGIFSFLLDPLINLKLGLPSSAGHNTAILNGTLKQAGAPRVREH